MNTRDALTDFLFIRDQPRAVDWVMVLGCPSITNMDPAISLFQAGLARNIIISGQGPTGDEEPEWRRYQTYAIEHGLPVAAMLIEPDARNTFDNFALSEKLLAREVGWDNIRSMAVVTRPFHTRRARMTARRFFPDNVDLVMLSPSDDGAIQAGTWWKTPSGRRRVLNEVRRIGEYGLKDHLGDY